MRESFTIGGKNFGINFKIKTKNMQMRKSAKRKMFIYLL